jgi:hypothetical protein
VNDHIGSEQVAKSTLSSGTVFAGKRFKVDIIKAIHGNNSNQTYSLIYALLDLHLIFILYIFD